MASIARTAGVAGSITLTTRNTAGQNIIPVSVPVVRWYTDAARTLNELTLTTTGSGSTYTSTWTAAQAPATAATRYLKVTIEVSTGVFDIDADDDIDFVDAASSIEGGYFDIATARNIDPAFRDEATYTDADVLRVRGEVEAAIEAACGASFVPRTVTETHSGSGGSTLLLGHIYPRPPIIAASITTNGVATALTAAELADLVIYDHGQVMRLTLGRWPLGNRNISITYTHGFDSPSAAPHGHLIAKAARILFRYWMKADKANIDPSMAGVRSISVEGLSTSYGSEGGPTDIPDVDRLIAQWNGRDGVVVA